MLGGQVGETSGRVTGTRVLPGDDYRYVKMEITVQETGTLCGAEGMNIGTYTIFERVPGQIYGQGQGIFESAGGDGAIWNGHAIGRPGSSGGMSTSIRFSIAFQAGQTGPLSRLNSVLVIGEHEVDVEGFTKTTFWEWK